MERTKRQKTLYLTQLALLSALIVVLQYIGNMIPIGQGVNLTLIPIVVGAALLGPTGGGILGLVCGAVVLLTGQAQGIMGYSPVMALLICFGKTGIAGFVSGWLYRLLAKKNRHLGVVVASISAPIINTALYLVGCAMILDYFVETGSAEPGTSVWAFILVTAGSIAGAFLIEFLFNAIGSTAIYQVVNVVEKRLKK